MSESRRERRKEKRQRVGIAASANLKLKYLIKSVEAGTLTEHEAINTWKDYCIANRLNDDVWDYCERLIEKLKVVE